MLNSKVKTRMKIINRKARFNFKLEPERYEAGIALTGEEVKAVKGGRVDISSAHAIIVQNEAWLLNANIMVAKDPTRTKKLLLKRQEITSIGSLLKLKRLTLVPLSMYTTRRLIKVKLALGKSKRKFEKKKTVKVRELERKLGSY